MSHFIVFVLACFVGFQVIWNVSHSLHTPLMAVTNAISASSSWARCCRSGALVGCGAFRHFGADRLDQHFGGFLVTRRMLAMFQKS
jgi:NAD(P) transhydrogenase subunit alpha